MSEEYVATEPDWVFETVVSHIQGPLTEEQSQRILYQWGEFVKVASARRMVCDFLIQEYIGETPGRVLHSPREIPRYSSLMICLYHNDRISPILFQSLRIMDKVDWTKS